MTSLSLCRIFTLMRTLLLQFALSFSIASTTFARAEIIDLGTLGGTESFAYAINDSSQVIGLSRTAGDEDLHVFLYTQGMLLDLSNRDQIMPGDYGVTANDVNNIGQIAGNLPNGHAAILTDGAAIDLGTFGGVFSSALGINNLGEIAGYYSSADLRNHAVLYRNGVATNLGPFDADAISIATGINDLGMVTGDASHSFLIPYSAFLYSNGVMTELHPFGSSESYARDINNKGQIVGEFFSTRAESFHGFIYNSDGTFTHLGTEGSPETNAYAINDNEQVVGTFDVPFQDVCVDPKTGEEYPCTHYKPHAFLYENGSLMDLNDLVDRTKPLLPWELTQALDINNRGEIVGYGLVDGNFHAFLILWTDNDPHSRARKLD